MELLLRTVLLPLSLLLVPRAAVRAQTECDPFCTCIAGLADCSARQAFDFRFTNIPVVPPTTTTLYVNHSLQVCIATSTTVLVS